MAMLNSARSRLLSAISSRTRIDQTCLGSRGRFWPIMRPLFQGARVGRRAGSVSMDMTSLLSTKPATSSALPTTHCNTDHRFCANQSYRPESGQIQLLRRIFGSADSGHWTALPEDAAYVAAKKQRPRRLDRAHRWNGCRRRSACLELGALSPRPWRKEIGQITNTNGSVRDQPKGGMRRFGGRQRAFQKTAAVTRRFCPSKN